MDYNEDRRVTLQNRKISLRKHIVDLEEHEHAYIYLDTIGMKYEGFTYLITILICFNNILEPLVLFGEGGYNLAELREIRVTESYLGLDQDVRNCQNDEPYMNCTTRQYVDTILKDCGCLPLNMKLSTQARACNYHII